MRTVHSFALVFFISLNAIAAEPPKLFEVPGVCSVGIPAQGFTWEKLRDEEKDGVRTVMLVASKEGATARVILVADGRRMETDPKRIATIKAQYNAMVDVLKRGGYTDSKGKQPSITPPIPEQVTFAISAKDREGNLTTFRSDTLFKKFTYQFQVIAESDQRAAELARVTKTLIEPK